jgi:hypothetical protein
VIYKNVYIRIMQSTVGRVNKMSSSAEWSGKGETQQTFVPPTQARPTTEELIKRSYPHRPSPYAGLVSDTTLVAFILVGMILVLVGAILVHAARWEVNLSPIGGILVDLGVFMVGCFLLLAGVLRTDLSERVRLALLIAAALIIAGALILLGSAFQIPIVTRA